MEQTKLDLFTSQKNGRRRTSKTNGQTNNEYLKSILDGHIKPNSIPSHNTITSLNQNSMSPSDVFSFAMAKVSQINQRIQDKCNTLKSISSLKDTSKVGTRKQNNFDVIHEQNEEDDIHKTDKAIGTTEKQIICPCHYNNKQATLRILTQSPPGCSRIVMSPQYPPIVYPPQIVNVRPVSAPKFQHAVPVVRTMAPLSRQAFQPTAPILCEPSSPTKLIYHEPIIRRNVPMSRVVSMPVPQQGTVIYHPEQAQSYVQTYGRQPMAMHTGIPNGMMPMQMPLQQQYPPQRQTYENREVQQLQRQQQQKVQSSPLQPQNNVDNANNKVSSANATNTSSTVNRTTTSTVNKKSQTNTKNVTNVTNVLYKTYDKMSTSQSNSANHFYSNNQMQNGMTADQFQKILQQQYLKYNEQNKQNKQNQPHPKLMNKSSKSINCIAPEQQKINKLMMTGSSKKLQYNVDDAFDQFNCFEDKLSLDKQLADLNDAKNLDEQRSMIKKMDQLIQKYGKTTPLPPIYQNSKPIPNQSATQMPQMAQSIVNPLNIHNNQLYIIDKPNYDKPQQRIFPPTFYEIPNTTQQPYSVGQQILKQTKIFMSQFMDMLRE